ncbi:MAG TPA: peptide ABC transporter substrate-binding protein [Ktedonobacteraceae bacterium]|nr:peptide ABC transporter substrate-binding protein [Ktedonobacteraceae bacterium]
MRYLRQHRQQPGPLVSLLFGVMLLLLTACGSNGNGGNAVPVATSTPRLAARQVLSFPNVGISDSGSLDPAQGPDPNTAIITTMVYSGLVTLDAQSNVIADQATWEISADNKVYTFHLKQDILFSDGSPVTAQSYVYTLTRALLPVVNSPIAAYYEGAIVGANNVMSGKAKTLAGVKALNAQTLQITLARPTPYFLYLLTNPIFFPVNPQMIQAYGQTDWVNNVADEAIGTGPFMIKEWDRNVKMVLVPNPYYYGAKTKLTEVDMFFVNDPSIAFQSYRSGQYDFVWNIQSSDQLAAKGMSGYSKVTQFETDALFFNNTMPPFDNATIRQAFAYATDKVTLAHTVFQDTVLPAQTIIPPGMAGYQQGYSGIPYNPTMAKTLWQSVYPANSSTGNTGTTVPTITFSYPGSLVSQQEASALQHMWESALGIQINLQSTEQTAYDDERAKKQIQFGFVQWSAEIPDPYDCLALNLLSTASNNNGGWNNPTFDQEVAQAEQTTGTTRLALYDQAEQIAIQDVGWLPLDHEELIAVIPPFIHGISINGNGLYFGDWSGVYIAPH